MRHVILSLVAICAINTFSYSAETRIMDFEENQREAIENKILLEITTFDGHVDEELKAILKNYSNYIIVTGGFLLWNIGAQEWGDWQSELLPAFLLLSTLCVGTAVLLVDLIKYSNGTSRRLEKMQKRKAKKEAKQLKKDMDFL
jgi:hypothetical protein